MQRSISLLFCRSGACAMENLQISHKETAIPTFLAGGIVIECIRKIMRRRRLSPLYRGVACKADRGVAPGLLLYRLIGRIAYRYNPQLRFAQQPPVEGAQGISCSFQSVREADTSILHFAFIIFHSI